MVRPTGSIQLDASGAVGWPDRRGSTRRLVMGAAVLGSAWLARPAHGQNAAGELAALFMLACVPFAGDAARLRDWATRQRLPIVPEPARSSFLNGAPGLVFDATSPFGKFVLVSGDDGLCSCIAGSARAESLTAALEEGLRAKGLRFTVVSQRSDRALPDLQFREYVAALDTRVWRILAATVRDPNGGRAMLTAGPGRVEPR